MQDIIVGDHYRLGARIAVGGFGLVYSGTDTRSGDEVALKLIHIRDDTGTLKHEKDIYNVLDGGSGIPQVLWFGQEGDYFVLVHELLGPSLEDLFNYCNRKFSLKTVLLIADQAITRLKYIHSKGFLHRDIKPDNFLMGCGRQGNTLFAIDFGLAREFGPTESSQRDYGSGFGGGTTRYASLNNHNGKEQSFGDDLESLGYLFVYFLRGSLPWQGLKAKSEAEKNEMIKVKKTKISGDVLCKGLPRAFATYINYTGSLRFGTKPDYNYLRQLFRRLFDTESFTHDNVFDWTEKRFYEVRTTVG